MRQRGKVGSEAPLRSPRLAPPVGGFSRADGSRLAAFGVGRRRWGEGAALLRFGAPVRSIGVSREDLVIPGTVIQIGVAPRRIDLLTEVSGVDFEAAWASRVTHAVTSLQVPFLGRDALVRNKRAIGRPKDLADLDALGEGGLPSA